MIFVMVGHTYGFYRLVRKMDEIAGFIDEEVVMQIGYTSYRPENAKHFYFKRHRDILSFINQARVVVSHAGAGSIMDVLESRRPLIVVPRQLEYGEIYDDHQMIFCMALEKNEKINAVYNIELLESRLKDAREIALYTENQGSDIIGFLREALERFRRTGDFH